MGPQRAGLPFSRGQSSSRTEPVQAFSLNSVQLNMDKLSNPVLVAALVSSIGVAGTLTS